MRETKVNFTSTLIKSQDLYSLWTEAAESEGERDGHCQVVTALSSCIKRSHPALSLVVFHSPDENRKRNSLAPQLLYVHSVLVVFCGHPPGPCGGGARCPERCMRVPVVCVACGCRQQHAMHGRMHLLLAAAKCRRASILCEPKPTARRRRNQSSDGSPARVRSPPVVYSTTHH